MYYTRYFYYRIYKYYENGDWTPKFSTFALISLFLFFYITIILDLFTSFLLNVNISPNPDNYSKVWYLLFFIPLYLLYDKLIIKSGCHNKILEEFKNETRRQKTTSIIFTVLYFVLSIAFFIGALWLRQKYKGY